MDRSFLSRSNVIAASRPFVCVRLTTYENPAEAVLLKSFQVTRSGEVENTVFTILSPDGRRQLARASRSASQTFGDAARMADTMNRIAREYGAKPPARGSLPELPTVPNLRLAVNVAACDNQPLVVLVAPSEESRRSLEERLIPLAWSDPFLGRFVFVVVTETKELAGIEGVKATPGVLVVQPDRFGLKGKVLKQVGEKASQDELRKGLQEVASLYRNEEKTFGSHVREGQKQGIFWETVTPVTDPMEQRARERGRLQGPRPE
ncbi:MAG TPA: thioredoxin family protein [Gemmataceae bacterium]|nr:thioredoxin family protein [Gemmataceae bacterium]